MVVIKDYNKSITERLEEHRTCLVLLLLLRQVLPSQRHQHEICDWLLRKLSWLLQGWR